MKTPDESVHVRDTALQLGFNTRTTPAEQTQHPFRMLVIGDFGRRRSDTSPSGVTLRGEAPASLPEQLEVAIECSVENLFGSEPSQLAIELPIRRLGDFAERSLAANIEPLRRAAALHQAAASGYDQLEGFADLDKLVAAARGEPPKTPVADDAPVTSGGPAPSNADLLQSILGDEEPAPAPRSTGLSSLIGSIAHSAGRPSAPAKSLRERVAALDAIIAQQTSIIRRDPRFAGVEAVWRGLQVLLRNTGRADVQVDLLDVPAEDTARCLLSDVVPDELERMDGSPLSCVLVLGAVANDVDGVERLAYCAAAGSAMHVPVITSLRQGFFDNLSEETAAAWALLRSDDHAQWLAACHGDLVLETGERPTPLFGEPGWAVAALILSSFARTGWPTDLLDPARATVEGLDLHEVSGRGAVTAWPLRQPIGTAAADQLRGLGVIALAARPNRDHVFLYSTPTVAAGEGEDGATQLGSRLLASWLVAHLRAATLVVSGSSDAEWADAVRLVLSQSRELQQVRVTPHPRDNPSTARGFKIEVAANLPGLAVRQLSFDYWI